MKVVNLPDKVLTGLYEYQRALVLNGHIPGYLSHFTLRRHAQFYRNHPYCFRYMEQRHAARENVKRRLRAYGIITVCRKFGMYHHTVWADLHRKPVRLEVVARW